MSITTMNHLVMSLTTSKCSRTRSMCKRAQCHRVAHETRSWASTPSLSRRKKRLNQTWMTTERLKSPLKRCITVFRTRLNSKKSKTLLEGAVIKIVLKSRLSQAIVRPHLLTKVIKADLMTPSVAVAKAEGRSRCIMLALSLSMGLKSLVGAITQIQMRRRLSVSCRVSATKIRTQRNIKAIANLLLQWTSLLFHMMIKGHKMQAISRHQRSCQQEVVLDSNEPTCKWHITKRCSRKKKVQLIKKNMTSKRQIKRWDKTLKS